MERSARNTDYCVRCLSDGMTREAVTAIVMQMDEAERAAEDEYSRRLAACTACERLNGGMCADCGCYVELRAAKRRMHCPGIPPRW